MPHITIVGGGQAGLVLAIGLRKNGYQVRLAQNRSAEDIRSGKVLSSQCVFQTSCGGRVGATQARILEMLADECAARRACVLVTDIDSGEQRLIRPDEAANDPLQDLLEARLQQGRSALIQHAGRRLFFDVQAPAVRLFAIGATDIAQTLAAAAGLAGFEVTVVDPRTAFATPERFPQTPIAAEWPETALPRLGLDCYTAIALLAHEPRIDDPALGAALRAKCFYIGALGSRTTHARRLERMRAAGFSEAELAQIHSPIGLAIGAANPAEILIFDSDGARLSPTHAVKKGKRYRYYVSTALIARSRSEHPKGRRIPAGDIEGLVLDRLRARIIPATAETENTRSYQGGVWLPFLDTYRTMCLAPQPDFRRVLAGVLAMELAA